jgi:hypothetical protein
MKELSKISINVHGSTPYAEIDNELFVFSCTIDIWLEKLIQETEKGII